MAKTIIPGYNGFVEWTPETPGFGSARAGVKASWKDNESTPNYVHFGWDGTTFPATADPNEPLSGTQVSGSSWPGLVSSFKINDVPIVSSTRYLKAHGEKMRSTSVMHSKSGEDIKIDLECAVQPLSNKGIVESALKLFGYALAKTPIDVSNSATVPANTYDAVGNAIVKLDTSGATGSAVIVGEDIGSVGFSAGIEGSTTEYMVFWGCVAESATLSFAQDENAKMSLSFVGSGSFGPDPIDLINVKTQAKADLTPQYGATNQHVTTSNLLNPITYDSICNMRIRGREACTNSWPLTAPYGWTDMDPTRSIEIKVTNNMHYVKDIGCPETLRQTKIVETVVLSRDITVSLEIDYNSFTLFENVKAFWYYQLVFDLKYDMCSGQQKQCRLCFDGVRFNEMPLELNPENVIGETITSMPVNGFSMHDVDYPTAVIGST